MKFVPPCTPPLARPPALYSVTRGPEEGLDRLLWSWATPSCAAVSLIQIHPPTAPPCKHKPCKNFLLIKTLQNSPQKSAFSTPKIRSSPISPGNSPLPLTVLNESPPPPFDCWCFREGLPLSVIRWPFAAQNSPKILTSSVVTSNFRNDTIQLPEEFSNIP